MISGVNLHVNTKENQLSYIIFLRLFHNVLKFREVYSHKDKNLQHIAGAKGPLNRLLRSLPPLLASAAAFSASGENCTREGKKRANNARSLARSWAYLLLRRRLEHEATFERV